MIHSDDWPRTLSITISNVAHSQSMETVFLKNTEFWDIIKLQYMQTVYLYDLDYLNKIKFIKSQKLFNINFIF